MPFKVIIGTTAKQNTPFLYYLQKIQENLTHESVISDHMKHDSNGVYNFLEKV